MTSSLVEYSSAKEVPLDKIPTGFSFIVNGRVASVVHLGGKRLLKFETGFIPAVGRPHDGRSFSDMRAGNSPAKSMKEE